MLSVGNHFLPYFYHYFLLLFKIWFPVKIFPCAGNHFTSDNFLDYQFFFDSIIALLIAVPMWKRIGHRFLGTLKYVSNLVNGSSSSEKNIDSSEFRYHQSIYDIICWMDKCSCLEMVNFLASFPNSFDLNRIWNRFPFDDLNCLTV